MTQLILVRHGETEWNRVERFRGQVDIPLNATGLAQAAATAQRIEMEWRPVAIYSSPLSRAVQTGEAIAKPFHLSVVPLPGLIDIHFGDWQGLTPDEVQARWPVEYRHWLTRPGSARIPGGETLEELRQRGAQAIWELARQHSEEMIVVVGHTDINRAILLGLLGLDIDRFWQIGQDNCAVNRIDIHQNQVALVSWNETVHLRVFQKAGRMEPDPNLTN
jgi:broad specificity phosphatase PhoE